MNTTEQFLRQHAACPDGAAFARKYSTLANAWDACERPDWLLWAYQKAVKKPDEKQLRLFACWCVRQVWDQLTDPRSRRAVEVAEANAEGRASEGELVAARKEADAACSALLASAAYASAYAAASANNAAASWAAADAACSAAHAADAAAAADAYAADAAVLGAYFDVYAKTRKAQAAQLKLMVPNPFIK